MANRVDEGAARANEAPSYKKQTPESFYELARQCQDAIADHADVVIGSTEAMQPWMRLYGVSRGGAKRLTKVATHGLLTTNLRDQLLALPASQQKRVVSMAIFGHKGEYAELEPLDALSRRGEDTAEKRPYLSVPRKRRFGAAVLCVSTQRAVGKDEIQWDDAKKRAALARHDPVRFAASLAQDVLIGSVPDMLDAELKTALTIGLAARGGERTHIPLAEAPRGGVFSLGRSLGAYVAQKSPDVRAAFGKLGGLPSRLKAERLMLVGESHHDSRGRHIELVQSLASRTRGQESKLPSLSVDSKRTYAGLFRGARLLIDSMYVAQKAAERRDEIMRSYWRHYGKLFAAIDGAGEGRVAAFRRSGMLPGYEDPRHINYLGEPIEPSASAAAIEAPAAAQVEPSEVIMVGGVPMQRREPGATLSPEMRTQRSIAPVAAAKIPQADIDPEKAAATATNFFGGARRGPKAEAPNVVPPQKKAPEAELFPDAKYKKLMREGDRLRASSPIAFAPKQQL